MTDEARNEAKDEAVDEARNEAGAMLERARSVVAAAGVPGLELRPEADADVPFLAALYASTRAEEVARTGWPEARREAFLRQQFEAQRTHYRRHYPGACFGVLELDGRPIGRLYLARLPDGLRLMDVALLPERRGRGLGTALVRALLDDADRRGDEVRLHVEHDNPVRRLYDRLGFRMIEDRGVYAFLGRAPRPAGSGEEEER